MAPSGGEQENWPDTAEDARVTETSQEKEEERGGGESEQSKKINKIMEGDTEMSEPWAEAGGRC